VLDENSDFALRARKWVEESRLAQGLAVHVTDPVAVRKIARIFGWDEPALHDRDRRSVRSRAPKHQA
jgi:hypothetical protein